MKNKGIIKGVVIGVLSTLCVILILGTVFFEPIKRFISIQGSSSEREKILTEIDYLIDRDFLYNPDKTKMDNNAIKAYVAAMDDKYADYYTPDEFKVFKQMSTGKYYGIGITIVYDSEKSAYKIDSVNKGYGADEAGMKAGSYIHKIAGQEVKLDNINKLLMDIKKMKAGDTVEFELLQDDKIVQFNPVVKEIVKEVVSSQYLDGIVYLKLSEFDEVTHDQMMNELKKYDDIKGIILDLRNNPGGDLKAVIDVGSEFIKNDVLTYTENKKGKKEVYKTKNTGNLVGKKLAVLVNENSASASELLTGAIKDYNIGKIIGKKTFGKGIVQEIIPLTNGGAFKQTITKYFTPKGNDINKIGIEPDIKIDGENTNLELEKQPEIIEAIKQIKE